MCDVPYQAETMHYDFLPLGITNQAVKVLHFLTYDSYDILLLISNVKKGAAARSQWSQFDKVT